MYTLNLLFLTAGCFPQRGRGGLIFFDILTMFIDMLTIHDDILVI